MLLYSAGGSMEAITGWSHVAPGGKYSSKVQVDL